MDDMMVLGRPVLWETMFRFMDGNVSPSTGLTPEQVQAGLSKGKLTLLDVRSPDDGASDVEWMNPVRCNPVRRCTTLSPGLRCLARFCANSRVRCELRGDEREATGRCLECCDTPGAP
jgi:hypothetical protein